MQDIVLDDKWSRNITLCIWPMSMNGPFLRAKNIHFSIHKGDKTLQPLKMRIEKYVAEC